MLHAYQYEHELDIFLNVHELAFSYFIHTMILLMRRIRITDNRVYKTFVDLFKSYDATNRPDVLQSEERTHRSWTGLSMTYAQTPQKERRQSHTNRTNTYLEPNTVQINTTQAGNTFFARIYQIIPSTIFLPSLQNTELNR